MVKNPKVWLVIDFDDVLLHTRQIIQQRDKDIMAKAGLSEEDLSEIRKECREMNEFGKKIFKISKFIKKVKERSKNPETVDEIMESIDYNDFVDQSMTDFLRKVRTEIKGVKISILTLGEKEFQEHKINCTNIKDFVDEVIYTEGSKKEIVEAEMKKFDPKPFLITIDDKQENIDEYASLGIKNHINIMFDSASSAEKIWNEISAKLGPF